ncbi:MAG: basic secretory protein-like protein [Candidatus Sericytochromatia bacterium]
MKKVFKILIQSVFILSISNPTFSYENTENKNDDKIIWEKYNKNILLFNYTDENKDKINEIEKYFLNYHIIEDFFHHKFRKNINVYIFPNRKLLDTYWKTKSQCWMVASGSENELDLLSPSIWEKESCEHKNNKEEIEKIILHEMVHVYHDQYTEPTNFEGMDELGWLIEGLATYVANQIDEKRIKNIKKAILNNEIPKNLEDLWQGNNKYGFSGYMVKFIDENFGREKLFNLLSCSKNKDILIKLDLKEEKLLELFKKYIENDVKKYDKK